MASAEALVEAPMKVLLVTSWGTPCGIAEHSAQLIQYVEAADHTIQHEPSAAALDPEWVQRELQTRTWDLCVLNYHRGLHSRWTAEAIRHLPFPTIVVFHDTYKMQPDRLPWELLDACSAMVVHEPCDLLNTEAARVAYDSHLVRALVAGPDGTRGTFIEKNVAKVRYWRQPCPLPYMRGCPPYLPPGWSHEWRPTLGTVGFDFPWKNYDLLAEVTESLGWRLRISGQVSGRRQQELRAKNPQICFDGYCSTPEAISMLSSCAATAFLYTCGNSGTSGAIRLGMTAGKPLLATKGCRQFRDLQEARDGWPICWIEPTAEGLAQALIDLPMSQSYHLGLIGLAHKESWEKGGQQYAALYKEVAHG